MKRLIKKSEYFSGVKDVDWDDNDNEFETISVVYKNPTEKEVQDVKDISYNEVRVVITPGYDIYVWPSNTLHHTINRKMTDEGKNFDVDDAFRFHWTGGYWNCDFINRGFTVERAKQFIKDNQLQLSLIGNINADFHLNGCTDKPITDVNIKDF